MLCSPIRNSALTGTLVSAFPGIDSNMTGDAVTTTSLAA